MPTFFLVILLTSLGFSQPYLRSDWGSSWIDEDKDCQNTRQEVLIEESLIPVTYDDAGCKVIFGVWVSLYDGVIITDPSKLDIDHLVPLENANSSGGYEWIKSKKKEYTNYLYNPYHLIAVSSSTNRSKRSKSPDKWMPSYAPFRCTYVEQWVEVKNEWNLTMTESESKFVDSVLNACSE